MRTTLNLDDALVTAAKHEAARSGRTLTAVIEDALRLALSASDDAPDPPEDFRVRPFDGRGLQPGIDLDDGAALLEVMEGDR